MLAVHAACSERMLKMYALLKAFFLSEEKRRSDLHSLYSNIESVYNITVIFDNLITNNNNHDKKLAKTADHDKKLQLAVSCFLFC